MTARETALKVLIACRKEGGWSNGVLKNCLNRDRLDRRDSALATRLCYGVVQNRLLLDFYLGQLLKGKPGSLHPMVRDILHLGLYQLFLTDKIPPSAAVNESVELAKRYCAAQRNAPGLVNGVLREAIRSKETIQEPGDWSVRYSHPEALLSLLKGYVPKGQLEPMLQANNGIAPLYAQVNTLRITAEELIRRLEEEGVQAKPHSWLPDCLILSETGSLEQKSAFQEGLFYVQDPAAKLSVLCAQLSPGSRVLDCCAAPGGKSFAAAIAMGGQGQLLSCDVHPHKAELIRKGAQRLGLSCLEAFVQDATVFVPQWEGTMDAVIADVPCSGYGIIRKKPDIRYKDPATMTQLPRLQRQILEVQCRYVRDGGLLLYATCTLVREENEGVVTAFLNDHPEFSPEPLPLPPGFPEAQGGMVALIPGQYDTDGFFICRLRKKGTLCISNQ